LFNIFNFIFSLSIFWVSFENQEMLSNVILFTILIQKLRNIQIGVISKTLSFSEIDVTRKISKLTMGRILEKNLRLELEFIDKSSKILEEFETFKLPFQILMNPSFGLRSKNSEKLIPLFSLLKNERIW
jgi:hypothetical protein